MKSLSKIIKKHATSDCTEQFDVFFSEKRSIKQTAEHDKYQTYIQQIKVQAHEEAERIINEAKKQAISEQQTGFEEGLRQGLEHIKSLEATLQKLIQELKEFKETYPQQLEPQVVRLVMMVSQKIVKQSLEKDREMIIRNVHSAFREITDKEYIKIRVHADDIKIMNKFEPQLLELFHEIQKLEIIADESIDKGGCIIETNEGSIDATVKTQLKKIYASLATETVSSDLNIAS